MFEQEEEEVTQQADSGVLDDEFSIETKEESSLPTPIPKRDVFHAAPLVDRFAAALIDLVLVYILYWTISFIYRGIALANPVAPIPTVTIHGLIMHSLFILLALLYFCIAEFTFTATVGKMLCSIRVRSKFGEPPSFKAVLFRNMLRLLDILLMPVLVTGLLFEKTSLHQRLGDVLTRTVVVKPERNLKRILTPSEEGLASATGRSAAFIIDALLILSNVVGIFLIFNPDRALTNQILFLSLPVIIMIGLIVPEAIFGCTLGKIIFGYTVCHEDGTRLKISGAVIRNVMRLSDLNPFGYLTILISNRRQRLGDSAAHTIVMRAKRKFFPLIGNLLIAILMLSTLAIGLHNPNSFFRRGLFYNFLPAFSSGKFGELKKSDGLTKKLYISYFNFISQSGSDVERQPIYDPGEEIFFIVEISNFGTVEDRTQIREDVNITYPNGEELNLENFMEIKEKGSEEKPLKIENNIKLSYTSPPGRYIVELKLRDMAKGESTQTQRYFFVTSQDKRPLPPAVEEKESEPKGEEPKEENRGLRKEDFPNLLDSEG